MGQYSQSDVQQSPQGQGQYSLDDVQQPSASQRFMSWLKNDAASDVGNAALGFGKQYAKSMLTSPLTGAVGSAIQTAQAFGKNPVPQLEPTNTPQKVGSYAETGAELLGNAALGATKIPTMAKAGQKFQQVMGAARDVPVDISAAGNDALQLKDFASRGGRLPKVINDFVKRATDPNAGPITYEQARDFYSNARQLTVEEINALKPAVKRQVVNFANHLGDSIHQAAQSVGQGDNYAQAMKEYAQAKNLGDALDVLKKWGLRVGASATLGGAGYEGYRLFRDLF